MRRALPLFFGAWAACAYGQAPNAAGTGLLAANSIAKTANDALTPVQRRVRANPRHAHGL